jgi:syntaxin-binding protein 1
VTRRVCIVVVMSIIKDLKKTLLERMIGSVTHASDPSTPTLYQVLVMDALGTKILSSCARVYDIMQQGVLVMQNLLIEREALPDLQAIYFMEPSSANIDQLIADFSRPKKKGNQYRCAHVFLTSALDSKLMARLAQSPAIASVKTFVEMNCEFVAHEGRVFALDMEDISPIYLQDEAQTTLKKLVNKICNVLLTMKEKPILRYRATGPRAHINKAIARAVDGMMTNAIAKMGKSWPEQGSSPRGTLVICDRSIDMVAPLMHEFTYQAMIHDLLHVDGELVSVQSERKKSSKGEAKNDNALVLSEDDGMWVRFRHDHISNVTNKITEESREFARRNNAAVGQKKIAEGKERSAKDLIKLMQDLPKYKVQMGKFSKHFDLANACLGEGKRLDQLREIADFEQSVATGLTENAKSFSNKDALGGLAKLCQQADIRVLDKLRILMLFLICNGKLKDDTKRALMDDSRPAIDGRLQACMLNLGKFGVDIAAKAKAVKGKKNDIPQTEFSLMRYTPKIKAVMQSLVARNLSTDDYPFINAEDASAPKEKSSRRRKHWRSGRNAEEKEGEKEDEGEKLMVFMLGGMTYSETRAAYEVMKEQRGQGVSLIAGGSHLLTPEVFVRQLTGMSEEDFRSIVAGKEINTDEIVINID